MNTKPRPAPSPAGSFMHLRAHQERRLHVHAERRTTAGALYPDPADITERAQPTNQRPIAGAGGGETVRPQHLLPGIDHRGDVQVFVGPTDVSVGRVS